MENLLHLEAIAKYTVRLLIIQIYFKTVKTLFKVNFHFTNVGNKLLKNLSKNIAYQSTFHLINVLYSSWSFQILGVDHIILELIYDTGTYNMAINKMYLLVQIFLLQLLGTEGQNHPGPV
jgi:hypothetical protein